MKSNSESLTEEVRETVSRLPDEELARIVNSKRQEYTALARSVAREELARRNRMRSSLSNADGQDTAQAEPVTIRSGCYIDVWTETNFEGEHLRIDGPVECSRLIFDELDFGGRISSLRLGPVAFVLAYAEEEFRGTMTSFGPGNEIPDLAQLSFDNTIDSLRLINSMKIFDDSRHEKDKGSVFAQASQRNAKRRASHKKHVTRRIK